MEKKYRADNGLNGFTWIMLLLLLSGMLIYQVMTNENVWFIILWYPFIFMAILTQTVKEYAITESLEIRFIVPYLRKTINIPPENIVSIRQIKKNQIRIDKKRGFEILKVKEEDLAALMSDLKEQNPLIVLE